MFSLTRAAYDGVAKMHELRWFSNFCSFATRTQNLTLFRFVQEFNQYQ
jgi:hypothetical protein